MDVFDENLDLFMPKICTKVTYVLSRKIPIYNLREYVTQVSRIIYGNLQY